MKKSKDRLMNGWLYKGIERVSDEVKGWSRKRKTQNVSKKALIKQNWRRIYIKIKWDI